MKTSLLIANAPKQKVGIRAHGMRGNFFKRAAIIAPFALAAIVFSANSAKAQMDTSAMMFLNTQHPGFAEAFSSPSKADKDTIAITSRPAKLGIKLNPETKPMEIARSSKAAKDTAQNAQNLNVEMNRDKTQEARDNIVDIAVTIFVGLAVIALSALSTTSLLLRRARRELK